jgi:curved DNA-binding protein CbpA
MRDLFAVLGEPREPWFDLAKLEERYRESSLTTHPDRLPGDAAGDESFVAISEAYRVLKDPKQRIQHLLQLEGHELGKDNNVPQSLLPLFSRIGDFIARATKLCQRRGESQNAISKSILQAETVSSQREVETLLHDAKGLFRQAEEAARSLNDSWRSKPDELAKVYSLFGFLTRWIAQLEEWKFRLENS